MAALLAVPLESRLAATATATTTADAAAAIRGGSTAAIAAGPTGNPAMPANAGLDGLVDKLAAAPAAPGEVASASGIMADTNIQAALAPGIAAVTAKGSDVAPIQARETALGPGMPMAADSSTVPAQADAAGAGLPDPSSGQKGPSLDSVAAALDGQAEPLPEAADAPTFTTTGLLLLPTTAALQQPGSMVVSNGSVATTSAFLLPDVGSSDWGKALGQQMIHLSAADRQVAELQLNPPGLGPLKVMLSVNDQQMQAAFVSAHPLVRSAVEAALPQLRALLLESGISLGQTSVGAESQPQTAFGNGQGDPGGHSPRPGYRATDADTAARFSAQPVTIQRRPSQGLRIDTYA